MSLQTRLRSIERHVDGRGCPECGYYKGTRVEFRIVIDPEECERHEDESCRTCGRELSVDIGGDE